MMMKRAGIVAIAALLVTSLAGALAIAQSEVDLPGYVRSDLHLISQESKPAWTPRWTGPIESATILAWLYDHGYPAFLRDFNADGVIDELDTIELADILGRDLMWTDTAKGTTDARLVVGLARYVADQYPDQFVLKIYDEGFPSEFAADGFGSFAPDAIPGVVLEVHADATIAAYEYELETAEGVIVGLEQTDELNTYLAGRSFLYETSPDGHTPVDLAWADEDRWAPGHQGKVLETEARMHEWMEILYRGLFTRVEFMLALSPLEERPIGSDEYLCPEDALAYHVTENEIGDFGTVRIEECVVREGDIDTYIYIVTNIDFLFNGCGLCTFAVAHPLGMPIVNHAEAVPWQFMNFPVAWVWKLPLGSCGLLPGQTAVLSVSVPGPTIDVWVPAVVLPCPPAPPAPVNGVVVLRESDETRPIVPVFPVRTTGPGYDDASCPDLVVRVLDHSCVRDPAVGAWVVTVWGEVRNIGSAPVLDPTGVAVTSDNFPAGDFLPLFPPIAPGDVIPFTLSYPIPPGVSACPEPFTVRVDPNDDILECEEKNNADVGETCCGEIVEKCPDLIIEIIEIDCEYTVREYEVNVTAKITNIGNVTATNINVRLYTGSQNHFGNILSLAPLDSDTMNATFLFTHNNPPACPVDVDAKVDYTSTIDECDEGNNEDSASVYCPNCRKD